MLKLKFLAIFNCLFLKNDNFALCSRRFHCWNNDPSSWALVFGRSKSRVRCFDSVWVIQFCSVVLEDEKSWSSFVLFPISGEASFISGSESRVHFSDGSGTGRYIFHCKCSFWLQKILSKNSCSWSNLVTMFGFSNVKPIKIAHPFYREEFDPDRCN